VSLEDRFARLAVLQREVVALARKTAAIDVRSFESDPPEILATRLSPRVLELLVEGRHLLAEIVRVCEPDDVSTHDGDAQETPLAYLPFEQVLEHEVERVAGIGTIGDIAFLAKLEVRERLECLARIAESPKHSTILAECDSSIRRLRKALVVLDQTFGRAGVGEARLILGRNTNEIGTVLGITPRTAKFHQQRVLEKIGADSRVDILRLLL